MARLCECGHSKTQHPDGICDYAGYACDCKGYKAARPAEATPQPPRAMSPLDLMERICQDAEAKKAVERAAWEEPGSQAEAGRRPAYVTEPRWRAMLRRTRARIEHSDDSHAEDDDLPTLAQLDDTDYITGTSSEETDG